MPADERGVEIGFFGGTVENVLGNAAAQQHVAGVRRAQRDQRQFQPDGSLEVREVRAGAVQFLLAYAVVLQAGD